MGNAVKGAGIGLILEGDDEKIAAAVTAGLDYLCRQRAAAGQDAEFRRHLP